MNIVYFQLKLSSNYSNIICTGCIESVENLYNVRSTFIFKQKMIYEYVDNIFSDLIPEHCIKNEVDSYETSINLGSILEVNIKNEFDDNSKINLVEKIDNR